MPLDEKAILGQIDAILHDYKQLTGRNKYDDYSDLPALEVSAVVTRILAAITRFAPLGSSYERNAESYEVTRAAAPGRYLDRLSGILTALRTDYAAGYMQSVVELVHSDLFADFLEMAEHLVEQGYKDPAAVVTGAVLEEHLRTLCIKSGITVVDGSGKAKKAEPLNAELRNASVYNLLEQKSVTAWLDLRNNAAHGRYAEYTKEHVDSAVQNVRSFISRFPA